MDKSIKPLSRLLLLVILVCGLSLQASQVNGVQTPSAPEFTLDLVESPYYVQPTYKSKIDPYTGKNVTRIDTPGRYVENKSIVITIKNQEFVSSVNGTKYHMAYKIVYKGHFGEEWEEDYFESQCTMTRYLSDGFPKASNSDYTVLRIPADYSPGVRLDVKVQAYIGHEAVIHVADYVAGHAFPIPAGSHDEDGIIFDTHGDWSEIQTITINFPPSAEQIILTGAPILIPIAVYLVGIIYIIKRKRSS